VSAPPRRAPDDLLAHLRRARDHADRHYAEPLDLDTLAAAVKHPNQPEIQVHLTIPGPPIAPHMIEAMNRALDEGGLFGLGLRVDDCRKTYDDLRTKGVEFIQPPEERPYGVEAVARDNSGNWMVLVEERPVTPADFG